MARLQYQNTEVPDFRASMQGYQMAGDALTRALGSADGLLAGFQREQTAAADNAVMLRALQQQDSNQYRQALSDGSLMQGIKPNQVSSSVLAALDARRGTLQQNEGTAYAQNRTRDLDARMDAANPAVAALAEAAARGDRDEIARIRGENEATLGNLSADQSLSLAQRMQGLAAGDLSQRSNEYSFNRGVEGDASNRAADALLTEGLRSVTNASEARSFLEKNSDASPEVLGKAMRALEQRFPGMYGPTQPGTGAGGWSMGGGQAVSAGAQRIPYGETRDYVQKILGNAPRLTGTSREMAQQLLPALIQQESGGRDGAVSGKGARGRTQVMPKTGTDPGYNVKPLQNQTPQEYERFATDYLTAMLDKYDGNPEAALAAYNAGPGTVDGWRSKGILQNSQADAAQLLSASRLSENRSRGIAGDLNETLGDNRDAAQIAQELQEGSFKGTAQGALVGQIDRIMKEANVNAATAGAVLRRNIEAAPTGILANIGYAGRRLSSPFAASRNLGNGIRLNDEGIAKEIENLKSGGAQREFLRNSNVQRQFQSVTSARDAVAQAQSQLAEASSKAASMPLFRQQLPRYQQRLELAQAALDLALRGQADPNNNPTSFQPQVLTKTGKRETDPERGRTAPNLENMTNMERSLYQRGLLPDYYFNQ